MRAPRGRGGEGEGEGCVLTRRLLAKLHKSALRDRSDAGVHIPQCRQQRMHQLGRIGRCCRVRTGGKGAPQLPSPQAPQQGVRRPQGGLRQRHRLGEQPSACMDDPEV